jgi:hypothetical protein
MIDFDTYIQIMIIMFSPLFTIIMFQFSSILNKTFLTTGLALLEIEDIEELTGINHKNIRMVNNKNNQTIFKIIDENNNEVSNIIFNTETIKLISTNNINIDQDKYFTLRKNKFAGLIRVEPDKISVSDNGNTFTQYDILDSGEKIMIGSVKFNDDSEPIEIIGEFKKYF